MLERKSPIQKGETVSDFTLKDQNGQEFKLSEEYLAEIGGNLKSRIVSGEVVLWLNLRRFLRQVG